MGNTSRAYVELVYLAVKGVCIVKEWSILQGWNELTANGMVVSVDGPSSNAVITLTNHPERSETILCILSLSVCKG